jgi:hypothetical protein
MLHRLATGDLYACRKLADDAEIDDHIIGFHAQQAVEKALKVALVLADSELPHTHDLELLVDQVKGAGTTVLTSYRAPNGLRRGQPNAATTSRSRSIAPPHLQRPRAQAAGRHRCSRTRSAPSLSPILGGNLGRKLHGRPSPKTTKALDFQGFR